MSGLAMAGVIIACGGEPPTDEASIVARTVPILHTDGTNEVRVQHPGVDTEWLLHLPEDVESFTSIYLTDSPKQVRWQAFDDGAIGFSWELPEDAVADPLDNLGRFPLAHGLEVSVRLLPAAGEVGLSVRLTNRTNRPIEDLISYGGCLQHRSETFFDDDASKTFVRTAKGVTDLYDEPIIREWEGFWGRSETRPAASVIVTSNTARKAVIGIAFESALSVSHSGTPQNCIHSGTRFGDLSPGASVKRQGLILFGRTPQELFDRFEARGYGRAGR